MPFTQEDADKLKARLLGPKETEYQSAAGKRRSENQELDQMLKVYALVEAQINPSPTYRRASHSRGFRPRRKRY